MSGMESEHKDMQQSLEMLIQYFGERAHEVKESVKFRGLSTSPQLGIIGSSVKDLMQHLDEIEQALNEEEKYVAECEAAGTAADEMHEYLDMVENHLPQHLPGTQQATTATTEVVVSKPKSQKRKRGAPMSDASNTTEAAPAEKSENKPSGSRKPKAKPQPAAPATSGSTAPATTLRYLTESELKKVPQYMRGRLTIEKVNGCIDEINALFEEKYAILALSPVTMNAVQMHKYTAYCDQNAKEVEGKRFICQGDLSSTTQLKSAATSRSVMQTLRHVGLLSMTTSNKVTRYVML